MTARALVAVALLGAAPVATEYEGLCDASAVVQIDNSVVVASDERSSSGGNILGVYRLGVPKGRIVPMGSGEEADLEGVARRGDRLFWIGSHGASKDGEARPARRVLFALRAEATPVGPRLSRAGGLYRNLLSDLARDQRYDGFGLAAAAMRAPEDGGLSIEGLTTQGDTLLIGLRSPVKGGRALVVTLLNPDGVIMGQRGRFGPPRQLDLGGRGIRAMDTRPDGSIVVVAGPPGRKGSFGVYDLTSTSMIQRAVDFGGLRPEGVAATPEGGLMFVSDDGDRKQRGQNCKDRPDSDRRFRLFYVAP